MDADYTQAEADGFDLVDKSLLDLDWTVVASNPWKRRHCIVAHESSAISWTVRHQFRNASEFGKRFLVLSNSITNILAYRKGKSSASDLLSQMRGTSAMLLSTGSRLAVRCIRSESNPSDGPSRGRPLVSVRPSS